MARTLGAFQRRRWGRRGQAIADFAFAFSLSILGQLATMGIRFCRWLYTLLRKAPQQNRYPTQTSTLKNPTASPAHDYRSRPKEYAPIGFRPDICFSDVAGLEDAKQEIRLRMIFPFLYPEKARHYGSRTGGGVLLYGPPGTGKTMLAISVGAEVDALFFHVRPSDILCGQVGQSEVNVANLFQRLRKEKRAVLFLDEVEALIPRRRHNGSTIMQRVISQFLVEVDGLAGAPEGNSLLLIGATNEPAMIDPAMLRPGRFDCKVYVGPPDHKARRQILTGCLRDRPIAEDVDINVLADLTEGLTGAELRRLVDSAADEAFLESLKGSTVNRQIMAQDLASAHKKMRFSFNR